jgi:hypothetical protein
METPRSPARHVADARVPAGLVREARRPAHEGDDLGRTVQGVGGGAHLSARGVFVSWAGRGVFGVSWAGRVVASWVAG